MELLTRADLNVLVTMRPGPCVSMLMPTSRGVAQEDKIRFKNLIREAEARLDKIKPSPAADLLTPARALLDDAPFWLNVSEGLAVYAAPQAFYSYRLPMVLPEQVVVAQRFHVKPLLPLLTGDGRFYVLAISQKHVRLLEGSRHTVRQLELQQVPTSMQEALQYDDIEVSRTVHTHPARAGNAYSREGIAHGHGVGIESAKDGFAEYMKKVDHSLRRHVHDAPLVLAAAEPLLSIYREINSYPHLLDEVVEGHPDRLSDQELHDRAWAVVVPHFREDVENNAALYRQLAGIGRTSNDLPKIVAESHQGRLQYLFVATDIDKWGKFNPDTGEVAIHEEEESGDEDLVNIAAVDALSHKTTVYGVNAQTMPDKEAAAAGIFWLPVGQRSTTKRI